MANGIATECGTIKPGEELHSPEWKRYWTPPAGKLRSSRDLAEYGFASMVVLVMYERGWWTAADLPDDAELARLTRCHSSDLKKLKRLRRSFERIPAPTLKAEIDRIHRWPAFLIREFRP